MVTLDLAEVLETRAALAERYRELRDRALDVTRPEPERVRDFRAANSTRAVLSKISQNLTRSAA